MNDDKSIILDEITGISDDKKLLEIFENSDDFDIRYSIVNLIDDDSILYEIFQKEENPFIKDIALDRISTDILDFDDFNNLDEYEKINYIESHHDESLLHEVAEHDESFYVRVAAISKISDRDFMLKMAKNHPDYDTRIVFYKKLNNQSLLEEITYENIIESLISLVKGLDNEAFLKDIFLNDSDIEVRIAALRKLKKDDFYYSLLKNALTDDDFKDYDSTFKNDDLSRLYDKITYIESQKDKSLLFDLAEHDESFYVRVAAIWKISDRDFMLKMANDHPDYDTRLVFYKKLNNMPFLDGITGENIIESNKKLVKSLDNEKFLKDIAINDSSIEVRIAALRKLNKPDFYFSLLKDTTDDDDLRQLIYDIKDESQLMNLAIFNSSNQSVVKYAINNIADPLILFELYRRGPTLIRETAVKKLVFGNVFSMKIANKISIQDMILRVCGYDVLVDIARNHPIYSIRRAAIERISDKDVLVEIAKNDPDSYIRRMVIERINDTGLWEYALRNDWDSDVREVAIEKIDDMGLLEDALRNDSSWEVRRAALRKIGDEDILVDVVRNDSHWAVRREAVGKIADEGVLVDVFRNDSSVEVRKRAFEMIDEDSLVDVLMNESNVNVIGETSPYVGVENVLGVLLRNIQDNEFRRAAVEKITDETVLVDVVRNDSSWEVRRAAVENIDDDDDVLADVVHNDPDFPVRSAAVRKIVDEGVLADVVRNDPDSHVRYYAVGRITDEDVLVDVVRNDPDDDVRSEAVRKIGDADVLVDVVRNDSSWEVRKEAVGKITDESFLVDVVQNDSDNSLRYNAIQKITDDAVLADVFRNDSDRSNRENALENIRDADILKNLLLENFGYLSFRSYTSFKRNYNNLIYDSLGTYEDILDKISDESVLMDMIHERLYGDFRVMIVRRLVSPDALRNLALNDLDYRVRRDAVRNPNLSDEETFVQIVQSDSNDAVRLEALKRIGGNDIIEDSKNDSSPLMRLYAYERLGWDLDLNENHVSWEDVDLSSMETIEDENMLHALAINAPSAPIRKYAFDKIKDEHILANIVCHSSEFTNRALNKIGDNELLLNIALYSMDESLRRKAAKKIDDEEFLLEAVESNPYNDISEYLIDRIKNESLLEIIAFNNSNPYNRKAAVNKIQSEDILIRLGENESEELVCTAIVRKCRDKGLLEYIGLSNPCKTVRRYVESVTDDDELLYKFALKECEFDNRREIISKLNNEVYIFNLLKVETSENVSDVNFEILDQDKLIDLVKNAFSYSVRYHALKNIEDESILRDFIYSSPFTSKNPKKNSVWEDMQFNDDCLPLCLCVLANPNFNDLKLIEDFLIENDMWMCAELYDIREKFTDVSTIKRIISDCKSEDVRKSFKYELKKYEDADEDRGRQGLGALFADDYDDNDRDGSNDNDENPKPQGLGALFG